MSTERFVSGTRFRWQNNTYEIKRLLPGNRVNIDDIFTGEVRTELLSTLVTALFAGDLRFPNLRGGRQVDAFKDETDLPVLALDDYPEHLVAIARVRLEIIQPLIELGENRTSADVKRHVEGVRAHRDKNYEKTLLRSVSVASAYRWLGVYVQSGKDIRSLIPSTNTRGGKGIARINPEVDGIINNVIQDKYMVREVTTIDDVEREVAVRLQESNVNRPMNEQLTRPSRSTIARRIEALDISEVFATKHGKRMAKRHLKQYKQMEKVTGPLERAEIDHTRADFIVIDDRDNLPLGRPNLTYCLDIGERYPLGYYTGFEPASSYSVMECLYHAIRPKENVRERYGTVHDWLAYGIPSTLVVDNGKEFIGKDLEEACLQLGIVLQFTPVQTPYFKPGIERVFGTMNTMLFHTLPGTTFSNPRPRGDYDSMQEACVYLSDLDKIMNIFIVDMYAEKFHRGLNGIPARQWEAATQFGFAPRLPPSAEELRILLSRVAQRTIHHYGIEFESLRYNCNDLLSLRLQLKGQPAKIKYHPGDLSRIHVYDPFDARYVEVPALAQEYTQGLSLWKHRVIREFARAERDTVDLVALGQARRKIQEIVEAGRERKRAGTRTQQARWDTAGKPTRDLQSRQQDATTQADDSMRSDDRQTPELHALSPDDLLISEDDQQAEAEGWELDFSLPNSYLHKRELDGGNRDSK
jgi:putative transposase